jgi:hypothetical protein
VRSRRDLGYLEETVSGRPCLGSCNMAVGLAHLQQVAAKFAEGEDVSKVLADPNTLFSWKICANCRVVLLAVVAPVVDALRRRP